MYINEVKKAIGFWGNKKMFEVTDIKKYNHTTTQGYYGVGIINGISYKVDCNEGQYTAVEY